ncbi:hypothetical protein [Dysgonomonas sp. 520]|uniref:hypothetical protein n=1 Tax=Dysgonomonas sp. 520 TaxID=2302931 RepID=UPI0013D4543D|nr:hypothetical protein [Dysgonomonas sp. 520]
MRMICNKCKEEFDTDKGYYNYPSGAVCSSCGSKSVGVRELIESWLSVQSTLGRLK